MPDDKDPILPLDAQALLRDLHQRTAQRVYRLCLLHVRQHEVAEDLCQEVYVKVFLKLGQFRQEAQLDTWLYRVAVNTCLDYLRQQKRRARLERLWSFFRPQDEQDQIDRLSPAQVLEQADSRDILYAALDKLPEMQRNVFMLSKVEGLSLDEIVAVLGLTKPAVEALQHRAKTNLRKQISKMIGDLSQVLPDYNV